MKKMLLLVMIGLLLVGFGCGKKEKPQPKAQENTQQTQQQASDWVFIGENSAVKVWAYAKGLKKVDDTHFGMFLRQVWSPEYQKSVIAKASTNEEKNIINKKAFSLLGVVVDCSQGSMATLGIRYFDKDAKEYWAKDYVKENTWVKNDYTSKLVPALCEKVKTGAIKP